MGNLTEAEARLHRLMRAFVQRDPSFGHVPGLAEVAVVLGRYVEEEMSFWLLCTMMEELRPEAFHAKPPMAEAGLLAEVTTYGNLPATRAGGLAW